MMKRALPTLTIAVVIACAVASAVIAGAPDSRSSIIHDMAARTITVNARFDGLQIQRTNDGVVALSCPGLPNTLQAGLPAVPVKTFLIALPRGTRLANVRIDEGTAEIFKGKVQPARSMVPYTRHHPGGTARAAAQPPRVEGPQFPASRVQYSVQYLHHVPVVVVDVFPCVVFPDRGTYSQVHEVRAVMTYAADPALAGVRPLYAHEVRAVRDLVDNPQILDREVLTAAENTAGYDYLILSCDTFINFKGPGNLKDLQDNLLTRDLRSKVVDVATIPGSTQGRDLAEQIRNFIKSEYEKNGIRYVLLAADGDSDGPGAVIPARRLWSKIRSYDGSWSITEENIPADLYYSCLDGDFDGNGNGVWGEPNDGPGGQDVDLLAEVCVGRWPMKSTTDLQNLVKKTIAMASRPQPKTVLMMGEALFPELNLYGDDYMNQLAGTCSDHGFVTHGYGTDWSVDHLYDRTGGWSGSDAISKISGGNFTMINHVGHSNTDYNMRMSSSRIRRLVNPRPFFYYTQGCFPGDFTADDCFIEYLIRSDKGAVAAIANTCYGLGPEDPDPSSTQTPGASQMLHRRFIDAVFAPAFVSLGRANQQSKEAFIGQASAQEIRWVMWDANYFGDPSLRFEY